MKTVERKLNKAQKATVWLLIIALLFVAAYVVLTFVIKNRKVGGSEQPELPELLEGESLYLNQLVAYAPIQESQILSVEIDNKQGLFGVTRYPDTEGSFYFYYGVDGREGVVPYVPPILGSEESYSYETLYAVESGDSFGRIYYLTYLCSALGAPYFNERIELPDDEAKRSDMLREYGITKSEITTISFDYCQRDENGAVIKDSEKGIDIILGGKPLSGKGYYFMLADRPDHVYYTRSEYFSYAMKGFGEFIKGMLVAEGLSQESVYGPYLTTDFKTWLGTTYDKEDDVVFLENKPGYQTTVITNGNSTITVDKGLDFVPKEGELFSGYETDEKIDLTFDLDAMKEHPDYERIKAALVGKQVGEQAEDILLTLLTELHSADNKTLTFGEDGSVKYKYTISKIESVITDDGEITSGAVDASHKLIKVTYRYTVVGESAETTKTVAHDCHAVIDVANLTAEQSAFFVGKPVGAALDTPIEFEIDYTKENSLTSTEKLVLTDIVAIFDKNVNLTSTVTEDGYVNLTFYYVIDGKEGEKQTRSFALSDIKEGSKLMPLKKLLIGKETGKYNETVYDLEYNYEFMREFSSYEISKIKYFVVNEMIVSFEFCNASQRDPFFGETFFKNTLENENRLYGLNSGVCETVVKLLGGVGTDSNSAVGYSGQTVAVGLTAANMDKYGLYAHKIYFEMPREIYDATEDNVDADENSLSDFAWKRTLGFTLYVSDKKYDKESGGWIRHVGSDMYDIIVKVKSEDFDFLEYGFVEFWARRSMIMVDITKLDELDIEFCMDDLKGRFDFRFNFEEIKTEAANGTVTTETHQDVFLTASSDAFESTFTKLFGTKETDLASLYNHTMGGGKPINYPGSNTSMGASYFNSTFETLQLISYLDCLTEKEKAESEDAPRIMRIHLKLENTEYYYTYDFHRIDDRRIRVKLYRSDENGDKVERLGEVSDFYITTFAFKKLVNNYIYLLDGKAVDESVGYPG